MTPLLTDSSCCSQTLRRKIEPANRALEEAVLNLVLARTSYTTLKLHLYVERF
jgi:hypothetical protein